jgi:branched-chain amino acid transport system substrate-binding protein
MPVMTSNRALKGLGGIVLLSSMAGSAIPQAAHAQRAHANATVTIGVSVPLLQLPDLATGIANGVKVALQQANAANLVPGVTFQASVKDDTINNSNNPEKDANNARAFIADTTLIGEVGPLNSGATKGSEAVYNNQGLVQISPSNSNVDLTDPKLRAKYEPRAASGKGPNTYFRVVTTDAYQGPSDALYAAKVLKVKSVFVTDNTDPYGVGLAAAFKAECQKLGIKVLGTGELDLTQPNLGAGQVAQNIANVSHGKVDLVFFGGEYDSHSGGGTFLADAIKAQGIKAYFMGGDGIYSPTFISASSNGGVLTGFASNLGPDAFAFPAAAAFRAAEAKAFPHNPISSYDIESYDAANIIVQAYAKAVKAKQLTVGMAQNITTRSIIAKLVGQTKGYKGASGSITFDANGDVTSHTFSIYKVVGSGKSAKWEYVGIAPAS